MKRWRWLPALTILGLLASVPVHAQSGSASSPAFQFRFGGFFPAGDSRFWQDSEDVFTQEMSDFNGFDLGFSFVTPVTNHFEVGFNIDFYDETVRSAYRDFVDESGFPILHDAKLDLIPMMVDVRFLPGGRSSVRGRQGQYRVLKPAFYLGGGLGATYWEYEEVGDFLDFQFDPPEIFFDRFKEDGVAFAASALAGVELPLGSRWGFLVEGRYVWADDRFEDDFAGLGSLDLSGFSVQGGFALHF